MTDEEVQKLKDEHAKEIAKLNAKLDAEKKKKETDALKDMQKKHDEERAKWEKELKSEKDAHAKDVKELLLNGKKSSNEKDENRFENIRKKYGK